jgi:hypothetical protein
MKDIKVLLIEHNEKRKIYKDKISQAIGSQNVILIEEYNIDVLRKSLEENYFDFIFTDAFFLPAGTSHDGTDQKEWYALTEIVTLVREVDKRVNLILFTQFNDRLQEADLDGIDYVFDKRYISSDLFVWQIKRLIERNLNEDLNEHILIKTILDNLRLKQDTCWRSEMVEMLEKYRNGINETDQINIIKSSVLKLSYNCGLSDKAKKLFEAIQLQESLNIAGNPTKWGHLRHVINVFWLGYYIINNEIIDIVNTGKITFKQKPDETKEFYLNLINKTWFITSIFHDIGILGEKIDSLKDRINKGLSIYPIDEIQNKIEFKNKDFTFKEYDSFKGLIAGSFQNLHELLNDKHSKNSPDHGVLSAITLFKEFKNDVKKDVFLDPAIQAIAFHNLFQKNRQFLSKFNFKEFPILNLLILCDLLEVWDRGTGFESIYNELPIEKIDLISLSISDQSLQLIINYRLHNSILPTDVLFENSETKIIEIITDEVYPILDEMNKGGMPSINIIFRLNNRKTIRHWPIN